MSSPAPTHADDCERMLRILIDAPIDGLSFEEIQNITEAQGDRLSYRTINAILWDLRAQLSHEKVRTRAGKVTKYRLKKAE